MKEKGHPKLKRLTERLGSRFSSALGINLSSGDKREAFKWFLASILFGARISEIIVINTYREFEEEGVLSPEDILDTGWDGLVEILDKGGYVRYDFKTATKLLDVCRSLIERYKGDLNSLHSMASDEEDLEKRLKSLGKGIGDVTANIFLREMRGIWKKAEPLPSELVVMAARNTGIIPEEIKDKKEILRLLMEKWSSEGMKMKDFPDFEAALLRLGKDYCRNALCERCPVKEDCKT
jgi:endonuclease III